MGSISASDYTPVPPSTMPLISPSALLRAHLSQSPPTRPSGRTPTQSRPMNLNIRSPTHTNGSSLVRIGSTTVVCGVRAEILPVTEIPSYRVNKPFTSPDQQPDSTNDEQEIWLHNLLVPNIELATGCSPLHPANTAPSVEAQSISQRLLSLLRSSRPVKLSDLEICHHSEPTLSAHEAAELGIVQSDEPELKGYWVLYIDLVCLSHGGTGSVFDAAWLAMYAALKDTILPKASWNVDEKQIFCSADVEEARRLELRSMPVALSFGMFVAEKRSVPDEDERERGKVLLVDLDSFEEESVSERGCVVVDVEDEGLMMKKIEKNGGGRIGVQEIRNVLTLAEDRWREWRIALEKGLKEAG